LDSRPDLNYAKLCDMLGADASSPQKRIKEWINAGGQIVPAFRVDELRKEIGDGKYKNWEEIHKVYELWEETYAPDKCRHAWAVLALLNGTEKTPDVAAFKKELSSVLETRRWIDEQIYESRAKDYRNPFKKATFRNQVEMEQVLGKPGDNSFIRLVRKESEEFIKLVEKIISRL